MDAVIKLGGDLKLLKSPELALLNNINVSLPLAEEVVISLKQTVAEVSIFLQFTRHACLTLLSNFGKFVVRFVWGGKG